MKIEPLDKKKIEELRLKQIRQAKEQRNRAIEKFCADPLSPLEKLFFKVPKNQSSFGVIK